MFYDRAYLPKVRRVVPAGNKISPGNPATKPDDTVVRTLWAELVGQLVARAGRQREGSTDARRSTGGAMSSAGSSHRGGRHCQKLSV